MKNITFNTGETSESLRARYNPNGSQLRKAQLKMLDILKYISKICEQNNLRYWLSSGTLLGAYRHQGFIPWDDDLDIEMPRADYLKLKDILLKSDNRDYILQDYSVDPNYYMAYAKIRDAHSMCIPCNHDEDLWRYRGIWIDIFILEEYDVKWQKIAFYTYTYGRRYLCSSNNFILKMLAKLRFGINYYIIFPILRPMANILSSHRELNNTLGTEYPLPRQKKYIYPLKKMMFEGTEFNVPNDVDGILSDHFTFDYHLLPPDNMRDGHQMSIKFNISK